MLFTNFVPEVEPSLFHNSLLLTAKNTPFGLATKSLMEALSKLMMDLVPAFVPSETQRESER
jgi:hypothetical protein